MVYNCQKHSGVVIHDIHNQNRMREGMLDVNHNPCANTFGKQPRNIYNTQTSNKLHHHTNTYITTY